MKILTLNAQKNHNPRLGAFLSDVVQSSVYDFVLLQEATEAVLALIEPADTYNLLTATDVQDGAQSMLSIFYNKQYVLRNHRHVSFTREHPSIHSPAEYGLLMGVFDAKNGPVVVSTFHLHSGLRTSVRSRELALAFKQVGALSGRVSSILGGDCNFGFPWELSGAERSAPKFSCVSRGAGATIDSRFTERADNAISAIAAAFARMGVGISLQFDHFFVDKITTAQRDMSCHIIPVRVSDHLPLELVIER